MSFGQFLGFGSDACAVLDRDGTIVAVNDVWRRRAESAGAVAGTGPQADYLAVCRRAASVGAPQAALALATVEASLAGREGLSSYLYPCTMTSGTHWFRADVLAVGASGHVGVRHVDITAPHRPAPAGSDGLVDTATVVMTAGGLRLAVADALDGPPHPAVLLLLTDLPVRGESETAAALSLAVAAGDRPVTVARLDDHLVALLVTAPDTAAAMSTADGIVHGVARAGWAVARWAIARATADDDADTLLARARRTLLRTLGGRDETARSLRLQDTAAVLAAAVDEFDHALDRGVDLLRLRELDHQVHRAELACAEAGADLLGASGPLGASAPRGA